MEPHNDIATIIERNRRVEREKAWETSRTRRAAIASITYVTASLFLWSLGSTQFFLQALIPSVGYLFSTLSLPWLRKYWMGRSLRDGEE